MVAHITIDSDRLRWINEALVRGCEWFTMGRSRCSRASLKLRGSAVREHRYARNWEAALQLIASEK